jgi:hypothetical protein
MDNYANFLLTIFCYDTKTVRRFCIGISLEDPRVEGGAVFDFWAEPENSAVLTSLLYSYWLEGEIQVIGCEKIEGAVQWSPETPSQPLT